MIEISAITFFIIISLIALALLGGSYYLFRLQSEREKTKLAKEELEKQIGALQKASEEQKDVLAHEREQRAAKEKDLAVINTKYQDLKEQYDQYKLDQKGLEDRFVNLANQVLSSQSEQFDEKQRKGLADMLAPLKERIQHFESKVDGANKEAIARVSALKEQIRSLSEMGDRMSQETINLTRALKGDNKQQGNWGEMVLESILERSGLEKGREYEVQPTLVTADQRRQRPDVTIHTPDGKVIIVDSKVSLTAYERLVNTDSGGGEGAKSAKEHVRSIKSHIDELSQKAYHDLYQEECPDFVMMFIPIDHALTVAMKADSEIYGYAFDKNVVIVTPGSLLASLKTVESLWKNEKQRQHALDIATEAGKMYDKFANFCTDLLEVGNRLQQTQGAYGKAMNKLTDGRGNLLVKAEKLKAMGAKATKTLPITSSSLQEGESEAA